MTPRRVVPALLAALLLAPTAAAGATFGPLEADLVGTPECALGTPEEACLATWETRGGPAPGDDAVGLSPFIARADVSVNAPGSPGHNVSVRPQEVEVAHPFNAIAKETWLFLNASRPGAVAPYVELQARPMPGYPQPPGTLFVTITFPAPLIFPLDGGAWPRTAIPLYSWDCSRYATPGAEWEDACSYHGIHPAPNGTRFTSTTDDHVDTPWRMAATSCDDYERIRPEACPPIEAARGGGALANDAWQDATPNVAMRVGVEEVRAQTGDTPPMGGRAGDGNAVGPRASRALPLPDAHRREPVGVAAGRDVVPPASGDQRSAAPPMPAPRARTPAAPEAPDAPPPGAPFTAAALVAGAGAFLLLLGVVLYHRLTRSRALENANRQRIVEAIRASPGIRAGTLATMLDLSHGTVTGHLRVLERFGIIEGAGEGQLRYFLAGAVTTHEKQLAVAASAPVARAILDHVAHHGESDFTTLCARLGLAPSTASVTLSRLQKAGIVTKQRRAGRLWFTLAR